jgi:predicted transcriptional regulator
MTTVGVKLDDEIRERLKALGTIKRRSAHWLMREAIQEYLDREEAIEARNREADQAWEAYRQSGQFASNEAVIAWLDTWGTDQEGPCPDLET